MGNYFYREKTDIGPYKILAELGRGTYGITYKIRDTIDNTVYAMKVINKELMAKHNMEQNIEFIRNEVYALSLLSSYDNGCSSHIVCYKELYENDDNIYIIMQYIKGLDLLDYTNVYYQTMIRGNNSLILSIMKQCLEGLNVVHKAGYAHRDIKLENIMIDYNNHIYLIDFGFVCNLNCVPGPGTIGYAPPELLLGISTNGLEFAQKHDIWSMGITFYSLVVGVDVVNIKLPVMTRYKNIPPLDTNDVLINTIVNSMIAFDPYQRPTVEELLNLFETEIDIV